MPEETLKTIHIPGHWESPKYNLGLMVKQGLIVGMEYNQPGTLRAHEIGKGWFYAVMKDDLENNIEILKESAIKPTTAEELQSKIDSLKALIQTYQNNIAAFGEVLRDLGD